MEGSVELGISKSCRDVGRLVGASVVRTRKRR
jgi:hypothetical protein